MKKIYLGADSAGYELKELLKQHLSEGGYTVVDAKSREEAVAVFCAYHPCEHPHIVNCSKFYNEEDFAKVCKGGLYLGVGCREEIAPLESSEAVLREQLCELKHILYDQCKSEEEKREAVFKYLGALSFADQIGSLPVKIRDSFERELNRMLCLSAKARPHRGKV